MTTKVTTRDGKYLGEPYHTEIIEAVHNGFDSVTFGDNRANIVSVYSTDEYKMIVVEVV